MFLAILRDFIFWWLKKKKKKKKNMIILKWSYLKTQSTFSKKVVKPFCEVVTTYLKNKSCKFQEILRNFIFWWFFDFSIFDHFDSAPSQAGECARRTAGIWPLLIRGMHIRSGGIQSLLVSEIEIDFQWVVLFSLSDHNRSFSPFFTIFRYVRQSRTLQCDEILTNGLL